MPKFTKYDLAAIRAKFKAGERLSSNEATLLNAFHAAERRVGK